MLPCIVWICVDGNVCIQSTGFKVTNYDGNLLDDFSTCCCSQSYTLFVVDALEFDLADFKRSFCWGIRAP